MRSKKKVTFDECRHDLGESSTIKILANFRTMVVPDKRYGVCTVCGQKFDILDEKIKKGGRS